MSTATEMLAAYLAAESAVLLGKEATIGDRRFRYEDLAEIRKGRAEWEARVASENDAAQAAPNIGGLGIKYARLDK